ncbi:MAG: dephospho-CoA kinase [Bacteroidales bacterium]|nr:dephospho-CoA kinase [Bacteroidales bacterium]
MKTVIVTGGIGSGKSAVCNLLRERGIPVYDCDSRAKALYDTDPSLLPLLEERLGRPLRLDDGKLDRAALAGLIFRDASARDTVESLLYPALLADFRSWREAVPSSAPFVVLESAVILSKPLFDGIADAVVLVDAAPEVRLARAMQRDGTSREKVLQRMAVQDIDSSRADVIIRNEGTLEELYKEAEQVFFGKNNYLCKILNNDLKAMKTDLAKTLSIRGQHGLFTYIAQSRSGAIVEALEDKKRSNFSASAGITTLADISIYTDEGEVKLQEVFGKLHEVLGDQDAPTAKAAPEELKALFAKALPNYDENRFYVSHMKKVVEWYNALKNFASLEFVTDEEREAEAAASQEEA